ncbi:hypothetical protein [Bergeyella sp. RCAD1439]|uniref:hypothetical protein n=1 Tax=Bergeyella anatis TaxID=3113737 RepID=UPI002E171002|nr:hypothetical protein [Bergeyella sp. RCAD1439]
MKNLIKIFTLFSFSLLILSCHNTAEVPEDVHDHEEIEKMTLTVSLQGSSEVQTISYVGGVADRDLVLESGKVYDVSVDFYHRHDDHYHSMLDEIIAEKDEHFVTFEVAGFTAQVVRAEDDVVRTDGHRLGLRTRWTITSAPSNARVDVKLYHGPTSVDQNYPSQGNQLGRVTGGEADVDAKITVK